MKRARSCLAGWGRYSSAQLNYIILFSGMGEAFFGTAELYLDVTDPCRAAYAPPAPVIPCVCEGGVEVKMVRGQCRVVERGGHKLFEGIPQ